MAQCREAIVWLMLTIIMAIVFSSHMVCAQRKGRGLTSQFVRPREASFDMPLDADVFQEPPGFNTPQQVHITQGDFYGTSVIISWVTPDHPGSSIVYYGTSAENYSFAATAEFAIQYSAYNYTSGFIHHCTIQDLQYSTTYFYKIGDANVSREFSFTTPPESGPDVPYTFGLIGDLGQTADSNRTLQHYMESKGQTVLFVGDCAYADKYPFYDNNRWDTWGRFVERSTAYQPWIWAAGNHDMEWGPKFGEHGDFKSFIHRLKTPYASSQSTSPLWYSIQRGPAYIIVLSSYSSFVKYSPQYNWLKEELPKVDRTKTPWLIIIMHIPFYNSNSAHYMEGEAMRNVFEAWFVEYKVDIVFSGHVHAFERTFSVSNIKSDLMNGDCLPVLNDDAPVYVVIGDGGNVEGLASQYIDPQPEYSAVREASFGHGIFDIVNRTHALFYWHRNQDGDAVMADSYWLNNQYWKTSVKERYCVVKDPQC